MQQGIINFLWVFFFGEEGRNDPIVFFPPPVCYEILISLSISHVFFSLKIHTPHDHQHTAEMSKRRSLLSLP